MSDEPRAVMLEAYLEFPLVATMGEVQHMQYCGEQQNINETIIWKFAHSSHHDVPMGVFSVHATASVKQARNHRWSHRLEIGQTTAG